MHGLLPCWWTSCLRYKYKVFISNLIIFLVCCIAILFPTSISFRWNYWISLLPYWSVRVMGTYKEILTYFIWSEFVTFWLVTWGEGVKANDEKEWDGGRGVKKRDFRSDILFAWPLIHRLRVMSCSPHDCSSKCENRKGGRGLLQCGDINKLYIFIRTQFFHSCKNTHLFPPLASENFNNF